MRIGLIPLDERPVNTRYPAMIAEIAGVELLEPPLDILSSRRRPANCEKILSWLHENANELDALIVSCEMLGYGGLIASRTTNDSAASIIARLDMLRQIRQANPGLSVSGFNVITRISRNNDNFEEPLYWSDYGERMYRFSQLLDQQKQGEKVTFELAEIQAQIPGEHIDDFLRRRLRNHIVNLSTLELAANGVCDVLVLSSDDTSVYGLGTREKRWLAEWVERLPEVEKRLLMYPGADEVGCALLARAVGHGQRAPQFAIHYAIPGDEEITAPFEDGPVRVTLERQIRAVGGEITADPDQADLIVAVNTPSRLRPSHYAEWSAEEEAHRTPYLKPFAEQIQAWITAGKHVIVADVAYPNGADPVLVNALFQYVEIDKLSAYGAWNTAGNTIGVALAQGIAALRIEDDRQQQAQRRFLVHRFLEDWGYMLVTRPMVRQGYIERCGTSEIAPEHIDGVKNEIEQVLSAQLARVPALGEQWRIVAGSVRLPWGRFFEVDFDLEPIKNR